MTVMPTRHVDPERLSAWISGDLTERETAVVRLHVEGTSHLVRRQQALWRE